MQIKLYGNGHSCNIPVQEIIDKYWKDETAPFSFEMSTAIGDETIAATAMLGEESPDTYPSIRLDSRNARKNSSATWFMYVVQQPFHRIAAPYVLLLWCGHGTRLSARFRLERRG